jgi:hypothetical protein
LISTGDGPVTRSKTIKNVRIVPSGAWCVNHTEQVWWFSHGGAV